MFQDIKVITGIHNVAYLCYLLGSDVTMDANSNSGRHSENKDFQIQLLKNKIQKKYQKIKLIFSENESIILNLQSNWGL